MNLKKYFFIAASVITMVATEALGVSRMYVNARKKPITLVIMLNDGQQKTLKIAGESSQTIDIGDALVSSIKVSGPDRRINLAGIETRSFVFDKNYKPKYESILNSPDNITVIDDDENPTRTRPFRLMEQSDAAGRAAIAKKLSQWSASAKEGLKKAAVKIGEGAVWVGEALKDLGTTATGIKTISK